MSINKVLLIGNVGKDPEVKYYENGGVVANFSVATTERGYTAANGTQVPDRTEWHNIVLWRGLAEVAEKYIRKGSKVYIEGKIRTRSYDDQQGNKRYITEIWGDNMEMLDRRPDSGRAPLPDASLAPAAPAAPAAPVTPTTSVATPTAATPPSQPATPPSQPATDTPPLKKDETDDLPF